MDRIVRGQSHPVLVGFLQAAAVAAYCALVGAFIFYAGDVLPQPGFLGITLMLVLLVFSAAVTGSLVFGLPVYLALKNKIREALQVLGFTLLSFFLIISAVFIVILSTA